MPSDWPLRRLPRPNDARVRLREVPASWWPSRSGEPTLAQHDPPWVLGPFRRDEIVVPVERL